MLTLGAVSYAFCDHVRLRTIELHILPTVPVSMPSPQHRARSHHRRAYSERPWLLPSRPDFSKRCRRVLTRKQSVFFYPRPPADVEAPIRSSQEASDRESRSRENHRWTPGIPLLSQSILF